MIRISGTVLHGKKQGRELGFPTANIALYEPVESGIYRGSVEIGILSYRAALFVGEKSSVLEAHIIGFSGDLYGKEIVVSLGEKIREVRTFTDSVLLQDQIKKDVEICSQE